VTTPKPLRGLACLVLAHHNAPQLALLLQWIDAAGGRTFLHIDRRARAMRAELLRAGLPGSAVLLPENESFRGRWGDYSLVAATLALLRQAVRDPATRHVALLSGTHLPLRPAAEIADLLFDGREHMDLVLAAAEPPEGKSLRRFWYRTVPGREERSALLRWVNSNTWPLGKRDLAAGLRGMTPMSGGQWWSLTGNCARRITVFIDANPWYPRFFRRVHIPDEAFFQTVVGATEFSDQLVPSPLYEVSAGFSPIVLRVPDLPAAQASGRPFGRKFDTRVDAEAVRLALEGAGGRTLQGP
jgi:Core-2/I-Branching enzyme